MVYPRVYPRYCRLTYPHQYHLPRNSVSRSPLAYATLLCVITWSTRSPHLARLVEQRVSLPSTTQIDKHQLQGAEFESGHGPWAMGMGPGRSNVVRGGRGAVHIRRAGCVSVTQGYVSICTKLYENSKLFGSP